MGRCHIFDKTAKISTGSRHILQFRHIVVVFVVMCLNDELKYAGSNCGLLEKNRVSQKNKRSLKRSTCRYFRRKSKTVKSGRKPIHQVEKDNRSDQDWAIETI